MAIAIIKSITSSKDGTRTVFRLEGKRVSYTTAQKLPQLNTLIGKEIDYRTVGVSNRQYYPFVVNTIKDTSTDKILYMYNRLIEVNNK